MGKIATLITYCTRCHDFFEPELDLCPNCGQQLEPRALVNAYELKQLITKLSTPEGIVNLLENFRKWIEE